MSEENAPTSPGARLHTSSAMVRAESTELDATLRALAGRLSSIPGLPVVVSHRGGRLRRLVGDLPYVNDLHRSTNPIRRIAVTVGNGSYWLDAGDGTIRCGRRIDPVGHDAVAEELPFADWANALF